MPLLLTAAELAASLPHTPLTLVRALMDDPVSGAADTRDAMVLPNTVDLDLDGEGSDHTTGVPHSMPPAKAFSVYLGRLGITATTHVVVYDTRGMYSAPRVWWMLKAMGHEKASVLNGGQIAWEAAKLPLSEHQPRSHVIYTPSPQPAWFVNSANVLQALNTETQLVDARSEARFTGSAPEPRSGLRSGHMPGAYNIPFGRLLKEGQFRSVDELTDVFTQAGINLALPIICTCGSGITACIVGVAALLCGAKSVSVYDGSWSEWGADPQFPIVAL